MISLLIFHLLRYFSGAAIINYLTLFRSSSWNKSIWYSK